MIILYGNCPEMSGNYIFFCPDVCSRLSEFVWFISSDAVYKIIFYTVSNFNDNINKLNYRNLIVSNIYLKNHNLSRIIENRLINTPLIIMIYF